MSWKTILSRGYPLLVLLILLPLVIQKAHAGQVRRLDINPDQPAVVHLAFGRTTAISFSSRPEKVVPGSPESIDVHFLGKDITIRPLSKRAGNLLVYTKTSRFVLLLQVGSEAQYDDVVKIAPALVRRPLRLMEDSYRVASLQVVAHQKSIDVPVSLRMDERSVQSAELKDALAPYPHLVCPACLIKRSSDFFKLTCAKAIHELNCHAGATQVTLRRSSS